MTERNEKVRQGNFISRLISSIGLRREEEEPKKPPMLFENTQLVIESIKELLDGDFLVYWTSNNSTIGEDDTIALERMLRHKKSSDRLFFFIKSYGGSGQGSLRIVHMLRQYYKQIIALVPLECASAATMLALGADKILMGPLACLSAIDTSITHEMAPSDKNDDPIYVSQNELDRVIKLWEQRKNPKDPNPYNALFTHIHPLVFGAVDRASYLSLKLTTEILSYHLEDMELAEKISHHLNTEYPLHSYPITYTEAKRIGLNVNTLDQALNEQLLRLNELYSEMAQQFLTFYGDTKFHHNEILSITEMTGEQLFFQKDRTYFQQQARRWRTWLDETSWRSITKSEGALKIEKFHLR